MARNNAICPQREPSTQDAKSTDHHNVDMAPSNITSTSSLDLIKFRAQYSRALTRTTCLIWFHTRKKIVIGSASLSRLLNALYYAAGSENLNPATPISTHHPQADLQTATTFQFILAHNTGSVCVKPLSLNAGPLGSLTNLLKMSIKEQGEDVLQVRLAAIRAFSALAPVLLRQTLGLDITELRPRFDPSMWPDAAGFNMKVVRYIACRHALELIRFISPHLDTHSGYINQCFNSLGLIDSYLTEDNGRGHSANLALAHSGDSLVPLIRFAASSEGRFALVVPTAAFYVLDQVPINLDGVKSTLCTTVLPPDCLPTLVRMIEHDDLANNGSVADLFEQMIQRMCDQSPQPPEVHGLSRLDTPGVQYLYCFSHMAQGFSSLLSAARNQKAIEGVVAGAARIIHLAAGNDLKYTVTPVELYSDAVPGFLNVVSMVSKFCSGKSDQNHLLFSFSEDLVRLLTVASEDAASKRRIVEHSAYHDLHSALKASENGGSTQRFLRRVEKLGTDLGIELRGNDPVLPSEDAKQAVGMTQQNDPMTSSAANESSSPTGIRKPTAEIAE
ncbi:hypothetical protein FRC07_000861 [Ceratobasidium sp. 392]|nr:hypothetical protein FRC07_000861 [Ceratobasidium sp. 392]